MTWARLEDTFPDHPKVMALSDAAFRQHVSAICYASRFNTDGEINHLALKAIRGSRSIATQLVRAGVWDETADGWSIHDFLDYNPSREEAAAKRVTRAEAGRRGGQRSGETRRSKTEANASKQNEAKPKQLLEAKSNPVPSRPEGEDVKTSSSSRFAADDDDLTPPQRDMAAAVLAKLPQQYQRDPLTVDEVGDFARDFAGQDVALAKAIQSCRRDGMLPFPGNLRRFMGRPAGEELPAPTGPYRTPLRVPPPVTRETIMASGRTAEEADEILSRMKTGGPR